jgi:hypothetical protein
MVITRSQSKKLLAREKARSNIVDLETTQRSLDDLCSDLSSLSDHDDASLRDSDALLDSPRDNNSIFEHPADIDVTGQKSQSM